jgi:hypothetical protein
MKKRATFTLNKAALNELERIAGELKVPKSKQKSF